MIIDNLLKFSEAQAITATAVSTNYLDLLNAGDAYLQNWLLAQVVTPFTDTGSDSTLVIDLVTSNSVSGGSLVSPVILYSTGVIPFANLGTVGNVLAKTRIPLGVRRYLRLNYTVAGGSFSAGALDALLVMDVEALV